MTGFTLDPRLAEDTVSIGDLDLSMVRLMNDRRFPWAILAPRRPGLVELFDLTRTERSLLMEEIALVAEALQRASGATKMNVAALGNQVRQLHVHVIGRKTTDAAWPNPVWSVGARELYPPGAAQTLAAALTKSLQLGPRPNTL